MQINAQTFMILADKQHIAFAFILLPILIKFEVDYVKRTVDTLNSPCLNGSELQFIVWNQ